MAAARSPCRCFKTRVLHFKVKNTPLKDKKWKEKVPENAQLSFCGGRAAFHQEIVPGGVIGISSDGDDRMELKVKTPKNP